MLHLALFFVLSAFSAARINFFAARIKFFTLLVVVIVEKYLYNIPVQHNRCRMATQITYSNARARLAELLDRVAEDQEVVYITRRDKEDVAMVSAAELSSLMETAHLLRSPENAVRLLRALLRAQLRKGRVRTLAQLKDEVGHVEEP